MSYAWHDFVGNVGVATILGSYLALQLGRLEGQSVAYSALNGLGAALVLVSLFYDFNLSAFVIEGCWVAISLFGLFRAWRQRRSPKRLSGCEQRREPVGPRAGHFELRGEAEEHGFFGRARHELHADGQPGRRPPPSASVQYSGTDIAGSPHRLASCVNGVAARRSSMSCSTKPALRSSPPVRVPHRRSASPRAPPATAFASRSPARARPPSASGRGRTYWW